MLKNNYFQYKRINKELEQYNIKFTIVSLIEVDEKNQIKGYGFRYKKELYYIVKELNGKYMICKIKNHKIYGTYAEGLNLKQLRISLKNILN